jgi:hypothetical protein
MAQIKRMDDTNSIFVMRIVSLVRDFFIYFMVIFQNYTTDLKMGKNSLQPHL